jgi:sortase A
MKYLGLVLVALGLGVLLLTYAPVLVQEVEYSLSPPPPVERIATSSAEIETVLADPVLRGAVLIPDNFEFSLLIPKIGVNSRVFANIDSGNQEEYLPILEQGVAHARGSSLPSQPGPVFIFAHSTDSFWNIRNYNAVFFLLNKLQAGEEVIVFYDNNKYKYEVSDKAIVEPDEISGIVSSQSGNVLILQTCYPPGTTTKRLLVFAKLI